MVRYIYISVILLVLPILSFPQENYLSLYNVNGWSYAGAWGTTDMQNTGMRIEEGSCPSDSVQRFNSYGWTCNPANFWALQNSFGKFEITEKFWPDKILIDFKVISITINIYMLGIAFSMVDTVGKGNVYAIYGQIPISSDWQTIELNCIGPKGNSVSKIGMDFPLYSVDSAYVGVELQVNNLRFVYNSGDTILVDPFQYDWITDVELVSNLIPSGFVLEQNYPNPFNPSTTIQYELPEFSPVKLTIYSLLGEEIAELINSEQSSGVYEVSFDATNLASGNYVYVLKTEKFQLERKMLLLK